MLEIMAKERGAKAYAVPLNLAGDNGTMIAWTGALMLKAGVEQRISETGVTQRFRTDAVNATWL